MSRANGFRVAAVLLCLWVPAVLMGQGQLSRAKELYAMASFDEALAILDTVQAGDADAVEPAEYRILCLLALNRTGDAQIAIEGLILRHPDFRPAAGIFSPRVRAQIDGVRGQVVRRAYAAAKAGFDARDYPAAEAGFDRVLQQLDVAADDPAMADLRLLASGFRDLAKASAATAVRALPAPGDASSERSPIETMTARSVDGVYDATAADVVAPVPLKPILLPVVAELLEAVPAPGLFELLIDEKGRVQSAVMRRSISPQYDALLLKEARTWRYRAATRDGAPVKFRKLIEIYTTPLSSIKRH